MTYNATEIFYEVNNDVIGKRSSIKFGPNDDDSFKASVNIYRLWLDDDPVAPGPYYTKTKGAMTINKTLSRIERTDTWTDIPASQKRERIKEIGKDQIPDWTPKELIKDPLREIDLTEGAARWKTMEDALASTDDADLDTFDTNLDNHIPDPGTLKRHIISSDGGGDGFVVGAIQMSILSTPPGVEWKLADGSDCSGTEYATISGNNTLPDLRGAYLRMAGQNGNPKWNGGSLGDWQEDHTALPHTPFATHTAGNHYHSLGWYDQESEDILQQYYNNTASNPSALAKHMWKREDPGAGNQAEGNEMEMATSTDGNHTHTITGGDSETRPKTYCVNYFIKVGGTSNV